MLETLDSVCWALENRDQDFYFASLEVFRTAFRDARREETDDRLELVRLRELQQKLEAEGEVARAAAVATIYDWLTLQRAERARRN